MDILVSPLEARPSPVVSATIPTERYSILTVSQLRVASRPNPEIDIGRIDSNCALLLCDAQKPDLPIVYCSEAFEHLTKYGSEEILGRNCRFLQSPDGKSPPSTSPVDVDDRQKLRSESVRRKETQTSLLNYKKGGQPFTNLLTTIPITWNSRDARFIVGFQVDRQTCG